MVIGGWYNGRNYNNPRSTLMISATVSVGLIIALIGWFATILLIRRSPLSNEKKRLLLAPSWLPWMLFAFGAPILSGALALPTAINIGGAMTIGMMVSMLMI